MKRGKVFFHPIDGTGQLSISWSERSKGNAVEAKKGNGVGFFSSKGILLAVLFDEIQSSKDQQVLEFAHYKIIVSVNDGVVCYKVIQSKSRGLKKKSASKQRLRKKTKH